MADKQAIYYELLILRCCRGQKEALKELVRSWERRLFYYIHRLDIMNKSEKTFGEKLIEMEKPNPTCREDGKSAITTKYP